MGGFFTFLFSTWLGYILFHYFSHPGKKKHKLPKIRLSFLEISPNLRIHFQRKTYHIHHWFILSVIAAALIIHYEGFQYLTFIKGAAIGGIIQGLRYPDRFKFRYHKSHEENQAKT